MVTNYSRAAKRVFMMAFWAVFFSDTAFAADAPLSALEHGLNDLIYQFSQSVVTVETSKPIATKAPEGYGDQSVSRLISSGIIYDSDGHVLVSASAVDGRDQIVVHFANQTIPAELRGIDYQTGLAVIYTNRSIGTPVVFDNRPGCAGQMVVAMGNAYGIQASPSLGFCAGARPDGVIQFSAPITSETVGGGLFDLSGNLVGIITGGIGSGRWAEAGLAVPAHEIPGIVRDLLANGDRLAGYIGITTTDIEIAPGLELTSPHQLISVGAQPSAVIEKGVLITSVVPFSPAARAGLKKGDLLFSLNDQSLSSSLELKNQVRQIPPERVIELGFIRYNRPYRTGVKVGRLELTALESDFIESNPLTPRSITADSLLNELNALKRTILLLERRLEGLK
jgi:S1-C subfamily serine protease